MSPKVSKEHKEQRRANILEAAKDVFIEHGYEQTTMKHIMDAANVSRGGLYQYFSNKEDVYEQILEEDLEASLNETEQILEEKVSSYWELLMTRMFGDDGKPDAEMDPLAPSNLEFFITGRNNERRRKYGTERYYTGLSVFQGIIEQGKRSGEFKTDFESEIIARSIISYIDGLALDHSILPEEDMKLKEQSEIFVEYLKLALGMKS